MLNIKTDGDGESTDSFGGLGVWWHPKSPDIKVNGVFRFSPDEGGHLTTTGSLQVASELEFDAVIFGEVKGIQYTLNAGFRSRVEDVLAGPLSRETWICTTVFKGAHLPEGSKTPFHSFNLKTELLGKWLFKPRPSVDRTQDNKMELSVSVPNRIDMDLDETTSASLTWTISSDLELMAASVVLTPVISVQTQKMNLYELQEELIDPVVYLISLCLGHADTVTALELHYHDSVLNRDCSVDVFEARWNRPTEKNMPRFSDEYVIKFDEVEPNLGDFISAWMVTYKSSRDSFLDYFAAFSMIICIQRRSS